MAGSSCCSSAENLLGEFGGWWRPTGRSSEQLRHINADAEVLVLGGYNPLPDHPLSGGISRYVKRWTKLLD